MGYMMLRKGIEHWKAFGFRAFLKKVYDVLFQKSSPEVIRRAQLTQAWTPKTLDVILRERFNQLQPLQVFYVPHSAQRINLVTDSINSGSLFGGVGTSMIFSALLAEAMGYSLRIITRTEKAQEQNFRHVLENNGITWMQNVEFVFANVLDGRSEVDIGDNDLFVTTSWWTTWGVIESIDEANIIYLLQEDERMFYPYGDDHLRCAEILNNSTIQFVVNSRLLYDYFVSEGLNNIRTNGLWFEPAFYPSTFFLEDTPRGEKSNFFFYARPNNVRNLFYLGVEAISEAVSRGILDLNKWELYFVGKDLPNLRIGKSYSPRLIENLTWREYGDLVRKIDLGLCLMYSPHPSYPPLDLAASGAVVVTNRFGPKQNLDSYSKNIHCRDADIENLVQGISDGVELTLDKETRVRNFEENGLILDWRESFEKVLIRLSGSR